MTCISCKYEFCWICLGDFTGSHYNCSDPSTQSGRDLESRFNATIQTLSFSQIYLLNCSYRQKDDVRTKKVAEQTMKSYVLTVPNANLENCEMIVQAVEHIFLFRLIILNLCKMGQYLIDHSLPNSKKLKARIPKIQGAANLICSTIEQPVKQLNFKNINSACETARKTIQELAYLLKEVFPQEAVISKKKKKAEK
jgi:hypothetical protein